MLLGIYPLQVNLLGVLFLITCLASFDAGRAQSETDHLIYSDPLQNYQWQFAPQEVAGLDVELLAFQVNFQNRAQTRATQDTLLLQFYVPKEQTQLIQIRKNDVYTHVTPLNNRWLQGVFKCLKIPNLLGFHLLPEAEDFWALGKIPGSDPELHFPVGLNARLPDTVAQYKFMFMPNMDIEIQYSIHQQTEAGSWKLVIPEDSSEFYPGHSTFPITWHGRLQGHPATEGIYKLVIKGKKYSGARELDMVKKYRFYHKPVYGQCQTKRE